MNSTRKLYVFIACSFFLSGGCALVYEIVWSTMLHHVFGDSVVAVAAVLASYMAGLALGSFALGRYADKARQPFRLYAYLEIGMGLCALAFPLVLPLIRGTYIWLHAWQIVSSQSVFHAISFCLSFVIILVPTTLMGGTLPVMAKFLVHRLDTSGKSVGFLYGTNTLGAVAGCVVAGLFGIVAVGAVQTSYIAAAINIIIGIAAYSIGASVSDKGLDSSPKAKAKRPAPKGKPSEVWPAYMNAIFLGVVAVSGFCALAYEVMWSRMLGFFVETTVYAFPIMLSTFLAGSAVGTLVMTMVLARKPHLDIAFLAVLQIAIGVVAMIGVVVLPNLRTLTMHTSDVESVAYVRFLVTGFAVSGFLVFIPALLIGMVIPLVVAFYSRHLSHIGAEVGGVYAGNTVGAICGALAASFVIIPALGIVNGIVACTMLNATAGLVVLAAHPKRSTQVKIAGAAIVVSLFLVGSIGFVPWGKSMCFFSGRYQTMLPDDYILHYDEGAGATVTVREVGPSVYRGQFVKFIEVNGVAVAGTSEMLRLTQKMQGHYPLLLYKACTGRDPRKVFILGLGTGESSHCITRHDIEGLDCLELASGEQEANHFFHDINHEILKEPKFKLTINDARNHLLTTNNRYDVIESDAVHPGVNMSTFTKEYFEICHEKLTEHGILSTWIPLFGLSKSNFQILIKSLNSVFPHIMIWYTPYARNKHAVLMGLKRPARIDPRLLEEAIHYPPVRASLAEIHMDDKYEFLSSFIGDEKSFASFAGDAKVNDDNHLYLPYYIPRQAQSGEKTVTQNILLLHEYQTAIGPYLREPSDTANLNLDTLKRCVEARNGFMLGLAGSYADQIPEALMFYRQTLFQLAPDNLNMRKQYIAERTAFLADQGFEAIRKGKIEEGLELVQNAAAFDSTNLCIRNWLGMAYLRAEMPDKALETVEKIIQEEPKFIEAHLNAAEAHKKKKEYQKARQKLAQILEMNPDSKVVKEAVESFWDTL